MKQPRRTYIVQSRILINVDKQTTKRLTFANVNKSKHVHRHDFQRVIQNRGFRLIAAKSTGVLRELKGYTKANEV